MNFETRASSFHLHRNKIKMAANLTSAHSGNAVVCTCASTLFLGPFCQNTVIFCVKKCRFSTFIYIFMASWPGMLTQCRPGVIPTLRWTFLWPSGRKYRGSNRCIPASMLFTIWSSKSSIPIYNLASEITSSKSKVSLNSISYPLLSNPYNSSIHQPSKNA